MAMTNGGGQFTKYEAVDSDGAVSPLALLYHYDPDTENTANIYSDQALSSALAQPFVADAAGRFVFYAKGDFDFLIKAADDATVLDTWDDVHISMGQSLITDWATEYPTANATNKGHLYGKIISNVLRGVAVNQDTSFIEIFSADASGNQTLGSVATKTHPRYDITHIDWGAVAGQASDQGPAIQKAINAIAIAGSGVLYIPKGTFQVDTTLDINNCSITIEGDGMGQSVLKQTADPATPVIDFDSTDKEDMVTLSGFSVTTTVVGSTTGIDLSWAASGTESERSNLLIENVYVGPHASTSATSYFADNIVLLNTQKGHLNNVMVSGHDTLLAGSDGITINGNIYSMTINNIMCQNLEIALDIAGTSAQLMAISNSLFRKVDTCINFTADSNMISITGCMLYSTDYGIRFLGANPITHFFHTITGNTFYAYSTGSWTGIQGVDVTSGSAIVGNTFLGVAGGTKGAITLGALSKRNTITGNTFNTFDTGITLGGDENISTGNGFTAVTTALVDTGDNRQDNNFPPTYATVASATALGSGVNGTKVSDIWNITGTTNITSMHADVSPWVGRTITLIFAGILTFTDGSNLVLAGNLVTSANDTITLQYDGTNWFELSRSVN